MDACLIDTHDIWLVQGDSDPPIIWQMLDSENPDVPSDLTGSIFELELKWNGGGVTLATGTDSEIVIDQALSRVIWNYPASRSASLPLGRVSRYYLRRTYQSKRRTLVEAYIDVKVDPL